MHIIIVGAGLSGLAAACRLTQLGHKVTVFERRATLSTTGGHIMVRSNVSKIVKQWGLGDDIEAISDVSLSGIYRRAEDGEVLHERLPAKYTEHPDWGTVRDRLLRVFYERAVANQADVSFGVAVTKVQEDEVKAFVKFDSGETVEADLVLATDGALSRLRQFILPDDIAAQARVASMTFHQVAVSEDELLEHPSTKHLTNDANLTVWFGQGSYAVGRYSTKLGRFGGIFAVPSGNEENPKLWEEGFSQTLEDIEVLTILLQQYNDLEYVTNIWEKVRIPRTARVKAFARTNHENYQLGGAQMVKQNANKNDSSTNEPANGQSAAVKPDRDAEFNSPAFNAWLYAYDAAEEVAKATTGLAK
ncbi:hypothetical protein PRZ48_010659 [Zasmidium cellare]|uniref:FAD-binding domain-containing protein n=1 Tax=Zasmidium cellare TaxID=395010 RepID=A0ABR0E995_ZASCE|nr:hypothetical protein PRZ48_010659 [Zasmidium cellare]